MAVPFFPTPYPDELFYSLIARYCAWSRISDSKTREDLLPSPTMRFAIGLPGNLQFLCDQLPAGSKLTPEGIVENQSVLPVFYPLFKENDAQILKQTMISERPRNTLGLIREETRYISQHLKFCPLCLYEDENRFGEPYWHRIHQLKGVFYCPKHGVALKNSIVNIKFRSGINIVPLTKDIRENPIQPVLLEKDRDFGHKIVQHYEWLLDHPTFCGQDSMIRRYTYYLNKYGLVSYSGKFKIEELQQHLKDFCSNNYFEECFWEINKRNSCRGILGSNYKGLYPLRHILLMEFLKVTPEHFFLHDVTRYRSGDHDCHPFGEGPWPCLNPLAEHYLQLVITDCVVEKHRGRPIGIFTCSCGFIYARKGPDSKMNSCFVFNRIIQLGNEWESELMRMHFEEQMPVKIIAQKAKMSLSFIRRRFRALTVKAGLCVDFIRKRDMYRKQFLSLRATNPKLSRKEILDKLPSASIWLKDNDAEWFENHMPLKRGEYLSNNDKKTSYRKKMVILLKIFPDANRDQLKRISDGLYKWLRCYDNAWFEQNMPPKRRFNDAYWVAKDHKLTKNIENIVERIKSAPGKPRRITNVLLQRELNEKRIGSPQGMRKFPLSKETLTRFIETIEDFRIRQITYGKSLMKEDGITRTKTEFYKMCGFNNNKLRTRVKDEFEKAFDSARQEVACCNEKETPDAKTDKQKVK